MKEDALSKVYGLAFDIKHFTNGIHRMKNDDDPVSELMRWQYRHSIQDLTKEMVAVLKASGLDFIEIMAFCTRLTDYLAQPEPRAMPLNQFVMSNLEPAERLAAAA